MWLQTEKKFCKRLLKNVQDTIFMLQGNINYIQWKMSLWKSVELSYQIKPFKICEHNFTF